MKIDPIRLAILGLALAGCTTIFPSAEQIEEAQLVSEKVDSKVLRSGRTLMITTCQECHRLVPPTTHAPQEWGPITERMGSMSGLDPSESAAVGAYLERAALWNEMQRAGQTGEGSEPPG